MLSTGSRHYLLLLLFSLCLLLVVVVVNGDESNHKYEMGEPIILWANHVGPHYNPLETYPYYESHVPVCKPKDPNTGEFKIEYKKLSIGEALQGHDLVKVYGVDIAFRRNTPVTRLCKLEIDEEKRKQYLYALDNQYWYQYYVDDLPVWAMIGGFATNNNNKKEKIPFIYTHQIYDIEWNDDRIVRVNLTTKRRTPLVENTNELTFTYEVNWHQNQKITYDNRFKVYLEHNPFQHKIHWFSIINSFMMVLFLSALVFMILIRTLRSDLAALEKHAKTKGDLEVGHESDSEFDILGSGDSSDSGPWKLLHGDVFRRPFGLTFLCAFIGTGFHLAFLALFLILLCVVNTFYDTRGAIMNAFIVLYCLTSIIGGYFSGHFYLKWKGDRWIRTALWTSCLFPLIIFVVVFCLNALAVSYNALVAIPFTTVLTVFVMWLLISLPLTFLGTILGRNFPAKHVGGRKDKEFPCNVNQFPRPIPQKPWYLSRLAIFFFSGILPFGSIFIEMYFVFTSFWNYKFYYVYGFLLLVFIILTIVTACVSIVSTYFLLNSEDWRWVWHSILVGVSISFYTLLYSIYFFNTKTRMKGLFQLVFYYGITLMFCIGLGFLCGAISFATTYLFVKRIYKDIKVD